ncbi:TPA: A/G-specific adenine glycosylase [Streptococcus equi subsp. zooepidemicus]|uniref:A/G-specific adenine glycosylase n=1 Tax=Streptococcus equi TaxID=1336 RepID=UPI001E5B28CB|nr:A/G-specific adenine glycosylase [Streptococcus equi]MCD3461740.1 A/G-specific adenine glycosylase [Streptococcus equi subsp. zooepidemicus]HEK9981113.1 A/G-specific adenine glycosylase [Streptococcus equi subsp. zooepidemicus]HEL0766078.1 A/G-specific adenine glycosylase [Streptococcus equi subsp. zooepidemicus]HEL0789975.1 A/G-specific adenine glycosylase [Streptococcus equi subsp. zooepidemicus]HEL1130340.1 A/G-specific adenine glycosylase [Streptococcus equi subsp. zooepidemicus]
MIDLNDYGITMWNQDTIASFRRTLLAWYDQEKRDLPWRRTKDPYHIWVSEIMLQQTQVVTVIPYYERFLDWFPTVEALACADEERLLKAWEGLGYYSRVRNMQKAAQQIMTDFGGIFPSSHADITKLKGIGPYTAGAISSIAFNLPEPAVDGNVMRVMARLFEIDYDIGDPKNRKIFQAVMEVLIDPDRPGDFNQALMDLGTDIEAAKNPRPDESPVRFFCAAYRHGTYDKYPIKEPKKKPRPIQVQAFVIRDSQGRLLLEKNTQGRLLGGFWSFPLIETDFVSQQLTLFEDKPVVLETMSQTALFEERYGLVPDWSQATFPQVKHTFSHQKWTIELCEGFTDSMPLAPDRELVWVAIEDMAAYPMATPQKKMLETYLSKQS